MQVVCFQQQNQWQRQRQVFVVIRGFQPFWHFLISNFISESMILPTKSPPNHDFDARTCHCRGCMSQFPQFWFSKLTEVFSKAESCVLIQGGVFEVISWSFFQKQLLRRSFFGVGNFKRGTSSGGAVFVAPVGSKNSILFLSSVLTVIDILN